jgi:inosine-uridine nucleoside N-ribohydrolase
MKRVIFDTDPGVDDAMALAFLAAHPDVEVAAITSVFGNAAVDITTRNALYLAQRFGVNAPVYAGAADPLAQSRLASPAFVHGHDGLGDVGVADSFSAEPAPGFAADRIVEIIRANPGEITLLAVGPLTNLALALQADPTIARDVAEVVIMGGVFREPGNVSPVAEANIRCDPHAADVVFGAAWPVTAVGLDVTHQTTLATHQAKSLADASPAGAFLWEISRSYEALYQERNGFPGCALHDVTAAICVVRPDLFQVSRGPIRAVADGIAVGQTIQKLESAQYPPTSWDERPSQSACIGVEAEAVVSLYRQTLAR